MVGPLNEPQKDLVERACRRTSKCLAFIAALLKLTRTKLAGRFVAVRIADTGMSISGADLPPIFEEFYRADNARALERDGTGLGLAFAEQVIERHGGRICVWNNAEAGATFGFTLAASTPE